jgi:hypothetical protein
VCLFRFAKTLAGVQSGNALHCRRRYQTREVARELAMRISALLPYSFPMGASQEVEVSYILDKSKVVNGANLAYASFLFEFI